VNREMATTKTRRYAIWYNNKDGKFAVVPMKRDDTIAPKYKKTTSVIRSTSPSKALKTLSARSYKQETGKSLYKRRKWGKKK